ncbi:MAG: ntpC [Bacillota bacterium]|jgi:V/A-type H+-transporting ATPase subunit C|nr:ntpC [Bacillota bacterium]
MTKIDETEYLFLTARVRSLENNMVNRERMEMMLESEKTEDVVRILQECGYGEFSAGSMESLEQSLASERQKTFHEIGFFMPNPQILDVFRIKDDYHNAKVLLKSMLQGIDGTGLLSDCGRVPLAVILRGIQQNELSDLPSKLQEAVTEAREVLSATKDPQMSDTILDRYYYEDLFLTAKKAKSDYLFGYVRISIDAANLRSVIRTIRMGKGPEFLRTKLFDGGNIHGSRIVETVVSGASLEEFYMTSPLREAAVAGALALQGGALTRFEKLCDDAVSHYLSNARFVPFGEQPVISYLAAKETEYTAVRIIMAGITAGLNRETIRERLREIYV